MRTLAFLLLLSALAACTSPKPCIRYIECPDGPADCQAQARELCPTGYNNVNEADLGDGFGDFARAHFPGASTGVPHIVVTCAQ